MGTLTANDVRWPDYCEHKLPTSCRLSSIPTCCACADERAHAPSYRTYIDGVGFVSRGTRWQRYCWYCKEFWENRVRASGLTHAQTRIPENPDQTVFLERWYEFHRGYRIVALSEGRQERIAVLGEDFVDVSPGSLPRTLDELREGRLAAEVQQPVQQHALMEQEDTGPSLDEMLDSMFREAENEEQPQSTATAIPSSSGAVTVGEQAAAELISIRPRQPIHGQAMNPASSRNREYQLRRVIALRRELTRMRTGIERVISGLRNLGEDVLDDAESVEVISRLDAMIERPLRENNADSSASTGTAQDTASTSIQARINEARINSNLARHERDQAASVLESAESEFQTSQQRLQQLQREQRTMENYTRVFGTREEVLAQGENYESPIGGMFNRAMERFRVAETSRREERTLRQVLEDEARIDSTEAVARRLEELESRERDVWGVPRSENVGILRDSDVPPSFDESLARRDALHTDATDSATRDETQTPPVLINTNEESALQEYYAMLRRQDGAVSHDDSLLDHGGIMRPLPPSIGRNIAAQLAQSTERMRDLAEAIQTIGDPISAARASSAQLSRAAVVEEEWWHEDAGTIINALTMDEALRQQVGMSLPAAANLLSYFNNNMISESDRMTIDGLLRNERAIWEVGLPVEWLRRRNESVQHDRAQTPVLFHPAEGHSEDWSLHYNYYLRCEITAQAYMISAQVRRCASTLSPPARLQMLYRLQAGRRITADVHVLHWLVVNPEAIDQASGRPFDLILSVYRRSQLGEEDEAAQVIDEERRLQARQGDHSRQELEARRRDASTQAFALAAGRRAMETGPQALIEQMANATAAAAAAEANDREAGTRAAFSRLQVNGFTRRPERTALYRQLTLSDYITSSPGSSRSSSPESAAGLDARDSGRPGPRPDEELQVSMECKICYTQMAEIACLPCGHLVMCRWCSEQHSPCLRHDRTRPRRPVGCPLCRKTIRQKVKIYRV